MSDSGRQSPHSLPSWEINSGFNHYRKSAPDHLLIIVKHRGSEWVLCHPSRQQDVSTSKGHFLSKKYTTVLVLDFSSEQMIYNVWLFPVGLNLVIKYLWESAD